MNGQRQSRFLAFLLAAVACVLGCRATPAAAHPAVSATALVKVDADGRVSMTVRFDALAFAINESPQRVADAPMYALLDGPEPALAEALAQAQDRFANLFVLNAGGRRVPVRISEFPTSSTVESWKLMHPDKRLLAKLDIVARAELPAAVHGFSLRFPEVLGDVIVTVDRPRLEPLTFPLRAGDESPPIDVYLGASDSGAHESMSVWDVAWRYTKLGFTHIIPGGADHALFVLGLFLLSPRFKAVLWQITAFTLAHSLTLTLTTLHIVSLPSVVVEPTIAATIAFVGIENLATTKVRPWRVAVTFLFGLVHGMGFASALGEIGLPTGQLATGLIAFNVGVEAGHITVLAAAFLVLGWWRDKPWYRSRVAVPLSILIAAIALFWMAQRLW